MEELEGLSNRGPDGYMDCESPAGRRNATLAMKHADNMRIRSYWLLRCSQRVELAVMMFAAHIWLSNELGLLRGTYGLAWRLMKMMGLVRREEYQTRCGFVPVFG